MKYYDFDGNEIPMLAWGMLFENPERQLAKDNINGHRISTVWLGIDHGYGKGFKPLIFETMIFCDVTFGHEGNPEGCSWNQREWRYATKEEAQRGHAIACNNMTGEKYDDE